ncbi:hypothetical protein [Bacillus sp. MUM 13]|uniref:TcaA second domain-containing protein n=1 Tax=Bacillus sp. MUM 13 TaxID=1678001 RepID=UPI0009F4438D|nr:hypothetical protein [Bacillus sp. MUM 13]
MPGKKRGIAAIAAAAVIIIIAIAVVFIQQSGKPGKIVEQFESAVEQNKPDQLKGIIIADKNSAKVDDRSLKAMTDYLKKNNDSYETIKDSLNKQAEDKDFTDASQQISLVKQGKTWGIFDDYKLKAKTVRIKVTGQNEEDKISMAADKGSMTLEKKKDSLYGPVLPGNYPLVITVNNKLGTFIEKKKTDAWGNSEVSVIIDEDKLVQNDKGVQKDILEALDQFNRDLTIYETSNFDTSKLTNVTNTIKEGSAYLKNNFELVKNYVDEIHSQYLGAVVNLDDLDISYFDNKWSASAKALVSYNSGMKYKNARVQDLSYKSIRSYSLQYDPENKKWLIDDLEDKEPFGPEETDWEHKQEMKIDDPPVMKWSRKSKGSKL